MAAAVDGLHPEDVVLVLDPVTVQSPIVPPSLAEVPPAPTNLRALVVVMALVLSVLAGALIVVLFRLRRKEALPAAAPAAAAPAQAQKPVISANVQRKVA